MVAQSDILFEEDDITSTAEGSRMKTQVCLAAISGTFSGTFQLKWEDENETVHDVYDDDGTILEFTGPGQKVLDFAIPVIVYWECTSYGSGTAKVSLTGTTRR